MGRDILNCSVCCERGIVLEIVWVWHKLLVSMSHVRTIPSLHLDNYDSAFKPFHSCTKIITIVHSSHVISAYRQLYSVHTTYTNALMHQLVTWFPKRTLRIMRYTQSIRTLWKAPHSVVLLAKPVGAQSPNGLPLGELINRTGSHLTTIIQMNVVQVPACPKCKRAYSSATGMTLWFAVFRCFGNFGARNLNLMQGNVTDFFS